MCDKLLGSWINGLIKIVWSPDIFCELKFFKFFCLEIDGVGNVLLAVLVNLEVLIFYIMIFAAMNMYEIKYMKTMIGRRRQFIIVYNF